MNYGELVSSSFASLRSNAVRTGLTMLGIIIGIFAITLILIISQSATAAITAKFSALGTKLLHIPRGPSETLTTEDANAVAAQVSGISMYAQEVNRNENVIANGKTKNITIEGVTPAYADIFSLKLKKGSFFSEDDLASYASVAVLGSQVESSLFGDGVDPIGQYVQIKGKFFYVIGVLSPKGTTLSGSTPDSSVFIPMTTVQNVITGSKNIDTIDLLAKKQNEVDTMSIQIKQILLDRYNVTDPQTIQDYAVFTSKDLLARISSIANIISAVLAGIAGISLLVGGIGIMNIMLVTVTERTKEIGLLKAIGATKKDILTQFLVESVILTLSGGLIGTFLGLIAGFVAAIVLKVPFTPPLFSIIVAALISILTGLIFGIYPAQRAAKMSPIDALRYE